MNKDHINKDQVIAKLREHEPNAKAGHCVWLETYTDPALRHFRDMTYVVARVPAPYHPHNITPRKDVPHSEF